MRIRLAAVAIACVAFAALPALAGAAAPESGVLADPAAQVSWQGAPFANVVTPLPAACGLSACDEFSLKIALPAGTWDQPGGVQIGVRWLDIEEGQDIDLYVYDESGAEAGHSNGFFASNGESVLLSKPANGTYRVLVVPRYTTAEGLEYEGLAEVERPAPSTPVRPMLPNLSALSPHNFHFAIGAYLTNPALPTNELSSCYPEEMLQQDARRCMRFDQGISNLGDGPFELRFRMEGIATDRELRQRIFRSDGSFSDRKADTYEFHAAHGHFHYRNFAQSRLWASNAAGERLGEKPVRVSRKNGFCMIDVLPVWWGLKGDGARTYYFPRCNAPTENEASGTYMTNGISVGWADIYNWYLADQFIEVTGVADGYYIVETEADAANTIVETDDRDNIGLSLIKLTGDKVELIHPVTRQEAGVPAPAGARMRVSVRPAKVRAGHKVRFRFTARVGLKGRGRPVPGAAIRFAGERVRTDANGRAALTKTFRRPGIHRIRATKRGLVSASARVRVVRG